MKRNLTGVKGVIASILIVLSLIVGVLNAVQGALPGVETLGVTNFDTLQVGDGSVSEPAFGFTSDTDNGLYRIGANNVGIAVGGSKIVDVAATGATIANLNATTITTTNLVSQSLGFTATGDSSFAGYNTFTGKIDAQGGAYLSAATITGTANAVGALQINSVAFTGPIKYGTQVYTSTGVTHGFATAPTACVVTPGGPFTATVTAIGASLFTLTVSSQGGTVYWMCGK